MSPRLVVMVATAVCVDMRPILPQRPGDSVVRPDILAVTCQGSACQDGLNAAESTKEFSWHVTQAHTRD